MDFPPPANATAIGFSESGSGESSRKQGRVNKFFGKNMFGAIDLLQGSKTNPASGSHVFSVKNFLRISACGFTWAGKCANNHRIIKIRCRVSQRLPDVLILQFGILALQICAVWISCNGFHHLPDRKAKLANARLAINPRWIGGDACKSHNPFRRQRNMILRKIASQLTA